MKKILIFVTVICLLLTTNYYPVSAGGNVYKGGRMIENEEVLKQLQENAWTPKPNPKSKSLTFGYAVSKIKEYIEADDQAIIVQGHEVASYKKITGRKLKFAAATKTQRTAIKWGVNTRLLWAHLYSDDPYGDIPDGRKVLTRWELIDLLSAVLDAYYTYRIPHFYDPEYFSEGLSPDINLSALYKGLVVSADYDKNAFGAAYKVSIYLNTQATREDLKLALKNLAIVVKNNGIKVVKNSTGSYDYDKACEDADEFVTKLYEETGYKMSVSKVDGVVTITDGFNYIMYLEDVNGKNWYPDIDFIYTSNTSDKCRAFRFSATEYDVLKMLLEACIIRAK